MNKCKLGELLEIKHGYAFKSENYVEKSQYALVTLANISGTNNFQFTKEKTTYYGAKFPEEFILKTGDLIMPLTEQVVGLFGNSAFVPEMENITFVLNQRVGKVIPKKGKADIYYLHYLLSTNSVREQLEYRASGTRQRNISPKDIYDVDVFVPDYEEQKKIGSTLYKLEQRVNNNNKINAELEYMAKTLYDYWFLQFEFPNEEGKPYKSSGGKMVWNEELKREIPEGWEVQTVKKCIHHINTGLNPRDNFKLGNGHIKYITVKNLTVNGTIDFSDCDQIDEEARKIVHKRSDVSRGDILFASIAPLGRCVIVQENPRDWDINESVFCIRPNLNKVSTELLYMFFMSDYFVKKAEHSSTGSVFNGIRISTLEGMLILIPTKSIKDKFTDTVKNIFAKKYQNEKENQEIISIRDFLLPLLMNGQVGFKE
ncbi:MAG TPA: restriction endonuclease subunit S [Candidatus Mediterraneibacter surreyensis]|nr:restriction endonuclease subunit S [Candidatus Mediterraneibacter surreyensis]